MSDETTRVAQWRAQGVPEVLLERAEPEDPTALELLGDIFDLGGLRKVERGASLDLQFDEGRCTWSLQTDRPLTVEGPFGTAPGELAWRAVIEGWGPLEETEDDEDGGHRFLFEHGEAKTDADGSFVGYAPYFEDEDDAEDADAETEDDDAE